MLFSIVLLSACLTSEEEYLQMRMALLDQDGDGFIWDQFPEEGGTDCDDFDSAIHPNADEVPYNNLDDDCTPETPDDDLDNDGFQLEVDCNDSDSTIHPGADEIIADDIDQDCDGYDNSPWTPSNGAQSGTFKTIIPNVANLPAYRASDEDDSETAYSEISGFLYGEEAAGNINLQAWSIDSSNQHTDLLSELTIAWDGRQTPYEVTLAVGYPSRIELLAFGTESYGTSGVTEVPTNNVLDNLHITINTNYGEMDSVVNVDIHDSTGLMSAGDDLVLYVVPESVFKTDPWPDPDSFSYFSAFSKMWEVSPTTIAGSFPPELVPNELTDARILVVGTTHDQEQVSGKSEAFVWGPGIVFDNVDLYLTEKH